METVSQSSSLLTLAVSLAPILTLLAALTVFKMKAYQAAVAAFFVALVCALFRFRGALPAVEIPQVVLSGVVFALCPICLVILAALFVYGVTVESGAMEKIRVMLASMSGDRRVLALLIVWGLAGFGTAVAIPAAILVGVGFDPLKSVLMCLVANTVPTAYGSVGVPLMTLAKESGCDLSSLTWTATCLQLPIAAAGPFLVLLTLDGFAGLKGMWRILLAADAAFLVPWLMSARFLGGELPDAVGIPEEQLRKAASMAVCKINIDSDLRLAMTASIREYMAGNPSHFDPRQYLKPARTAIKEMVKHKLINVLGCDGKA